MSQHKAKTMTTLNLLYTTGLHQEVYSFLNVAEKNSWEADVMALKAESSAAFSKRESDGVTTEVRTVYVNWKTRVVAFVEQCSESRTPMDIKWALNSAEEALGMQVTQWQSPPDSTLFE